MLFIGLQFVVWSVSGAYMVIMDIDYIHGDSLVTNEKQNIVPEQVKYSFTDLLTRYPQAENIELGLLLTKPVYRFDLKKQKRMVSAGDGQQLPKINIAMAIKLAKHHYANRQVEISKAQLITEKPPRELSARYLPVWRIDFDDFSSPSFYISVNSGQLVTKRHSFWRIFDWMFAFHVMDYIDEEADNRLLLIASTLALLASIFGLVLTYFRLAPKYNKKQNHQLNKPNKAGC